MPDLFDPTAEGWQVADLIGFMAFIGPIWQRERGGRTTYALQIDDRHANRNGVAHGGVAMTLLDTALGYLSLAAHGGRKQATIGLDVQFLGPLRLGEFAEVEGTVVRATRAILFMRGELRAGGEVRAVAQGTWKILGT